MALRRITLTFALLAASCGQRATMYETIHPARVAVHDAFEGERYAPWLKIEGTDNAGTSRCYYRAMGSLETLAGFQGDAAFAERYVATDRHLDIPFPRDEPLRDGCKPYPVQLAEHQFH